MLIMVNIWPNRERAEYSYFVRRDAVLFLQHHICRVDSSSSSSFSPPGPWRTWTCWKIATLLHMVNRSVILFLRTRQKQNQIELFSHAHSYTGNPPNQRTKNLSPNLQETFNTMIKGSISNALFILDISSLYGCTVSRLSLHLHQVHYSLPSSLPNHSPLSKKILAYLRDLAKRVRMSKGQWTSEVDGVAKFHSSAIAGYCLQTAEIYSHSESKRSSGNTTTSKRGESKQYQK